MRFYTGNIPSIFLLGFIWTSLLNCSGDAGNDSLSKTSTTGRIIEVGEFMDTPFKTLKEYRTDGLPGAIAVIHGFLRRDSDAYDYEVRFYESHDMAVELGISFAEEGSGPNAVIRERDAVYKEGIKDRRVVTGALAGAIEGGSVGPKYGGYVIYENLILLCQGFEFEQSFKRCNLLTDILRTTD